MRILLSLIAISLCGCHAAGTSCRSCGVAGAGKCGGMFGSLFCCEGNANYWRCWDKVSTKSEAKMLARRELKKLNQRQLSCDFRYGFEQAFEDISLGACGDVPPLPPALYWKVENRTAVGHQRAQEWFQGYAAGAAVAKSIYEPYNEVGSTGIAELHCPPEGNPYFGQAYVP